MMSTITLVNAISLSLLFSTFASDVATAGDTPNVLFILADDLGWSDTSICGKSIYYKTPNVSRLATRGMTFTRAYSASPLCSPTRASILTGLSPARHGITAPVCHLPSVLMTPRPGKKAPPGAKAVPVQSATRLDTSYYTLAEALQDAGYITGHFGKWHLGPPPHSALEHGFDVDVPHWPGPGPAGSYVAPWRFPDFNSQTPNEHIEDRMAKEAIAFISENRDRPFFLNYWMFSVHAPFDAKKKLLDKYSKALPLDSNQRCPTYAAMIESMDDAIGSLLDTLDAYGLAENTIVIFASDNGGNMYDDVGGVPPTDNSPLRGGKATMYEGGVRGPCVVVWPQHTRAGSTSSVPVQSCDFYPTLLEMLGLSPREGQIFDGASIVPALRGERLMARPIVTYYPHMPRVPEWLPPSASVHYGPWKLIRVFHGGEEGEHRHLLFNIEDDVGERFDLASSTPEMVRKLGGLIDKHLSQTNALLPTPNPAFDEAEYRPELEGVSALKTRP